MSRRRAPGEGVTATFPRGGTAEARVLRHLVLNGPASRAHLSEVLGLSAAAVSKAIASLQSADLLEDVGVVSSDSPGRPRTLLRIRPKEFGVIGVDLAREGVRAVKIDLTGAQVARAEARYGPEPARSTVESGLINVVQQLLDDDHQQVLAIGVGTPGPLDLRLGRVLNPPDFGAWADVPLQALLEERTGLPTWIDRDANAAALGSYWFGAAGGRENFAHILLGFGIGLGLVSNARLFHDGKGLTIDLAHTVIDFNGPPCKCGSRGCLHLYTSATALKAESRGGPTEQKELAEAGRALGYSLVNLVNTFHPELIVLSGIVADRDPVVLESARRVLSSVMLPRGEHIELVRSPLGREAVAFGGVALALEHLLGRGPYGPLREPGRRTLEQEVI
jgi:predicted NBD/HSP70 family sugar kinase